MPHQQPVGVPHVACVQRLDAEDLRARTRTHAMIATRRDQLRALLGELPTARERLYLEELGEELNARLRGVMLILAEVGECDALDQRGSSGAASAWRPTTRGWRPALRCCLRRTARRRCECFVRSDPELLEDCATACCP